MGTMEKIKYERKIKSIILSIIIISVLGLILSIMGLLMYLNTSIDTNTISKNSLANIYNPNNYLVQSYLQLVLSIILIYSSYHVWKNSDLWRKIFVVELYLAALFLFIMPWFNISNITNLGTQQQTWGDAKIRLVFWLIFTTYTVGIFFIYSAIYFSKEKIKQNFI